MLKESEAEILANTYMSTHTDTLLVALAAEPIVEEIIYHNSGERPSL